MEKQVNTDDLKIRNPREIVIFHRQIENEVGHRSNILDLYKALRLNSHEKESINEEVD